MFRKLGLLAVACLMVIPTTAALASDNQVVPTTAALDVDAPAPAPGVTPAKKPEGMKPRPYAVELQKKLKKDRKSTRLNSSH